MLNPGGEVNRHVRERFDTQLKLTELADNLFPLVLAFALRVVDLNRIQPGDGLNQHGLTLGGKAIGLLHLRQQRTLHHPVDEQCQRIAKQGHKGQRAADNANYQ